MVVRKLRLQRGWSQDQLAQFSGLSIRTIQRIERGQNAGLESLKSLASVFEIQATDLQQETSMNSKNAISEKEQKVIEYVRDIKGFYLHLVNYAIVISVLLIFNFVVYPDYIWAKWAAFGWGIGIGIVSHGLSVFEVFNFFGPNWERKQIEKKLGNKL